MDNQIVEKKAKQHLFQPGRSGNPNGRPKGSKNKITLMKLQLEGELRTQIGRDMKDIVAKGLEMAKNGDKDMIKLFVDKCVSTVKAGEDNDAGQEKIQIVIGRLPEREPVTINGEAVEV